MQVASFLNNHFLIAMPAMLDPNFSRAVTFVCQHSTEGAMGLMVNRISTLKLSDVLLQMQISTSIETIANAPVYLGGPVQPERGFVLHDIDGDWESTFQVSDRLAVTTSRDILVALADGRGPKRSLVALGYAGWSSGQLEQEMLDNAWLTAAAESSILFDTPLSKRWTAAARLVGFDPLNLSEYAGHA